MPRDRAVSLLLLDFDGTVVDSLPVFVEALNDAARRYRFGKMDAASLNQLRGLSSQSLARALGLSRWKMPLVAHHVRRYMRRRSDRLRMFEGMEDVLVELLDAGIRMAFVTSNSEWVVREVTGAAIAERVAHFECGVSVHGKARRFVRTLRRLGVEPCSALAVGDEQRDARAAREAGVMFAAVTWGFATPAALAVHQPAMLLHRPADLLQIIPSQP